MSEKKKLQLSDPHGTLVICAPCTLSGECYVHPVSSCCECCDCEPLTAELLERMLNHALRYDKPLPVNMA